MKSSALAVLSTILMFGCGEASDERLDEELIADDGADALSSPRYFYLGPNQSLNGYVIKSRSGNDLRVSFNTTSREATGKVTNLKTQSDSVLLRIRVTCSKGLTPIGNYTTVNLSPANPSGSGGSVYTACQDGKINTARLIVGGSMY